MMTRNANNCLLHKAKRNKNDEFYTLYRDIENELIHYSDKFENKVVYCNADDPRISNFYLFFAYNFKKLKLKKLICSFYQEQEENLFQFSEPKYGYYYEYMGTGKIIPELTDMERFRGDGDFRSEECLALMRMSDVVVTNPPFSLFREFINQIVSLKKEFLIISNINAITYKDVYTLIQENKMWLGVNFGRSISGFIVPDDYELYGTEARIDEAGNRIVSTNNCLWLTNLDHDQRHCFINLTKVYLGNEKEYPKYDNYNAINVDKSKDIPRDYPGIMGVPLTFLHKYNPEQFEIIRFRKGYDEKDLSIDGKIPYFRILIRHIQ